jgi:hypothetical protein
MRDGVPTAVVFASILLSVAPFLRAQSLADVARKEQERRKTIAQPAKVYTNKDLSPAPPPVALTTATTAVADDAKTPKPADAQAKDKDKSSATQTAEREPVKDKAYWAGRQKALQDQLDRDRTYADALQSRINALTADFVNRDDPVQRSVVERDRQKNVAELERLKRTIQDDQKALAEFSEEARRAGVPSGWLR